MVDRQALEALFRDRGLEDFTWSDAESIVVAQWARMKCRYGCDGYGLPIEVLASYDQVMNRYAFLLLE